MSFTTAALLVAWVAIALLAVGMAGLLAQVADLRRALGAPRPDAPGAGPAPDGIVGLRLPATGAVASLQPAGGGLVAFVAAGCSSCDAVLDDLARLHAGPVVLASVGTCPPVLAGLNARCVQVERADLALLQVPGTPFLMRVAADGTVTDTLLPLDSGDLAAWLATPAERKG